MQGCSSLGASFPSLPPAHRLLAVAETKTWKIDTCAAGFCGFWLFLWKAQWLKSLLGSEDYTAQGLCQQAQGMWDLSRATPMSLASSAPQDERVEQERFSCLLLIPGPWSRAEQSRATLCNKLSPAPSHSVMDTTRFSQARPGAAELGMEGPGWFSSLCWWNSAHAAHSTFSLTPPLAQLRLGKHPRSSREQRRLHQFSAQARVVQQLLHLFALKFLFKHVPL